MTGPLITPQARPTTESTSSGTGRCSTPSGRVVLQQAMPYCPRGDLGARAQSQLVADVAGVGVSGTLGNNQRCSNLLARPPLRNQRRYLSLTRRERANAGGHAVR